MKIDGIECEPIGVRTKQVLTVSFDPDDDAEVIKLLIAARGRAVEIDDRSYYIAGLNVGLDCVEFELTEA